MRFKAGTLVVTDYDIKAGITTGTIYEVLDFDNTVEGKELILIEDDNGQNTWQNPYKFYESK
jgi:hypothetical protein